MPAVISTDLVLLDAELGADKEAVVHALAGALVDAGRATDADRVATDALAREVTSPTGLPGGLAIPHCRTTAVAEPTLAFARLERAVDFGAKDGPAELVFLIAAPAGGDDAHLKLLARLAQALVRPAFTDALRAASTAEEAVQLVGAALDGTDVPAPAAPAARAAAPGGLITPELVALDADLGADKEAVIRALAGQLAAGGRATDAEQVAGDALAREAAGATGLTGGLALPHCRTGGVAEPAVAFARLQPGVAFGAKDGPADLVFLLTAPLDGGDRHLQLLARLAQALVRPEFSRALRSATSADEVVGLVGPALGG